MIHRNTRLAASPDARIRRVPEWGRCLVYAAADRPELYDLNTTAWLVLELCAAMDEARAREAFEAIVGRRVGEGEAAARLFEEGVERLLDAGILERMAPAPHDRPSQGQTNRSPAR